MKAVEYTMGGLRTFDFQLMTMFNNLCTEVHGTPFNGHSPPNEGNNELICMEHLCHQIQQPITEECVKQNVDDVVSENEDSDTEDNSDDIFIPGKEH